MPATARFDDASPYEGDILDLPVGDVDAAVDWYTTHFGMELVRRTETPTDQAVLRRDGDRFQVFFVVAPDGLCYYFQQRLDDTD
jgi:catechol 2,3-dioxygenase-like lactoylglutathione lyase family enzyme